MEPTLLLFVILFASFTQGVAGFGLGLVAMPFIIEPLGVQPSTSLIALIALICRIVLIIVYRESINVKVVTRLTIASILALPIGVLVLQRLDSVLVLALLGMVVSGYALYALLNLRLPAVAHPRWAYGFGFVSGLLSGAYNTGGPPIVMYGTSRRWGPAEFKSNIQGLGLFNSIVVIALHFVAHDYTPDVWQHFWVTLPAVLLGLLLGIGAARYINPMLFRRLILLMLLVVGLTLIF
ncbi:MAG: hypothetical protein CL610_28370 [Anaerolineaceae bacterium]|nr:hypothetical protein [Anaerolineaceae bacterium]